MVRVLPFIAFLSHVCSNFQEALRVTAKAKAGFPHDLQDLYDRGKRLILRSVEFGVTSVRAHVEVDKTVKRYCLQAGLQLKEELKHLCDVQIAGTQCSPCVMGRINC